MASFDLQLSPYRRGEEWAGFDVAYRVALPTVAQGQTLLRLPEVFLSMPASRIEGLLVSDAEGPLNLVEQDLVSDPSGTYRSWTADRDTAGELSVTVRSPAREIDELTPVGPLLDLRPEPWGLFGAGGYFIPLPVVEGEFDIRLDWSLPEGATAVTTRGQGSQSWKGDVQSVSYAYYGAGTPQIVPADSPNFGIHAYSDTPYDLETVAAYVRELHGHMSGFFEDSGSNFQVLVRRFLGKGDGGTALPPGSFAFGYSAVEPKDATELTWLLAHEMTHNWPHLDGAFDGSGLHSWYSEGAAEYYSHAIPLRAGLQSAEVIAEHLSGRLREYDVNPLRVLSNLDAANSSWTDARAQRIPYGRGLQYLISTDGYIREATQGARSLDDIVLALLRAQRKGEPAGAERWVELVAELTGPIAKERFEAMAAGMPIEQPSVAWEGSLRPVYVENPEFDLGFDVASYAGSPRKVKGLIRGSNAELAGVREGDILVDKALPYHATRSFGKEMILPLMRDGNRIDVSYHPSGRLVPGIAFVAE